MIRTTSALHADKDTAARPVRVLLVEDDEEDYRLTIDLLQEIGERRFVLDWAASYKGAVEAVARQEHDVYLVDYRLGQHDGVELLGLPALCGKPVIMLTGLDDPDADRRAMEAGAADYLVKGRVDAPLLERSIRYSIQRKRSEEALRRAHDELERRVEERTAELRQSEERFRLLVEGVKDYAIYLLDPEGHVVSWNEGAERIKGYKAEEVVGKHFSIFYPEEAIGQGWPRVVLDRAKTEGYYGEEGWRLRKDGSRYWASVLTTALRDEASNLKGFSKIVRDLTERKQVMEALQDADRRKDEFLAMLGHELRNPLAAIRNGLHILFLSKGNGDVAARVKDMMDKQVNNLTRMVDDLLDVSRITRGKIQLRKEKVELAKAMNLAVESVRPLMDAQNHKLTVAPPTHPVCLEADPTRLEQVLVNLLNNAAKYTKQGGYITMIAEQEGDEAVIRVRDNGIGIRPELLPKVFDLFVQSERALDRSQGGLGIGLTLVKKLVEMHGGSVEAHSEGVDKGSEFVVRLPALPKKEDAPEAPSDLSATANGKLRVLVVEDSEDVALSLKMLLGFWGYDVRIVLDGPSALVAYRTYQPDVVLLDIGLPGMNGYDVARLLRREQNPKMPFIMAVTGYGQDEDKRRSQEAGFNCHMTKPVDPDKLQTLLASVPALVKTT